MPVHSIYILIDGVGREFNQQRVHARLVPDARADSAWPEIALFCSDDRSAIAPKDLAYAGRQRSHTLWVIEEVFAV